MSCWCKGGEKGAQPLAWTPFFPRTPILPEHPFLPPHTGRTTPAAAAAQSETRPGAAVTGVEPTGRGQLARASRKRGPWAPLCAKAGEGLQGCPELAGSRDGRRLVAAPHPDFPGEQGGSAVHWAAPPPALSGLRGLARLPTPPSRAAIPIGRALPALPHPPRHLALSPPPPLTSSSSPVGPPAAPRSPPHSQISAHLPPCTARRASGCCSWLGFFFIPPLG